MIDKFAPTGSTASSEFLDLNCTSKLMILVSLLIPGFAIEVAAGGVRTSESGH
jgi:hypothetical protein